MANRRHLVVLGLAVLVLLLAGPVQAHYVGLIYYPPAQDADGSLYVSGTDGIVYALDERGEPRWTYNASAELTTRAVVAGDAVLVGTVDGRILAVRATDGTERWTTTLGSGVEQRRVTSVVAVDRTVYAMSGSSLHALDTQRGDEQWSLGVDGRTSAGPVVTGDGVYVGTATESGGKLLARTHSGEARWTREFDTRVTALAAGPDGTAYVGTTAGLRAVAADGSDLWTVAVGHVWQPPAVSDSGVVVGTFDGRLVRVADGTVQWTYDAEGASAPAFGPEGERVYAVTPRAVVAVEDGERQWRTETGATLLAAPTVGQSRVYVGTQVNRTYALSTNGSIVWIDRYATPFGAFGVASEDAVLPEFLDDVPGTPTRVVTKEGATASQSAVSPTGGHYVAPDVGFGVVTVLVLGGFLVVLRRLAG